VNKASSKKFQQVVYEHYGAHGRHDLPWRQPEADSSFDPYKILVSEIMLQQTQVPRVMSKYAAFLEKFPTVETLAAAPLKDVLIAWQGLGYNRRAKFLWQAAKYVMEEYGGEFPSTVEALTKLPGVGKNTAGAIQAYTFNQPAVFIETNIRTVFIHHFFKDQANIADTDIMPLIAQTLDTADPRRFYWALMDYGTYLKQTVGNRSRASKSYTKQSKFAGSARQIRGQVLRLLSEGPVIGSALLMSLADARAEAVVGDLEKEGLIRRNGDTYELPEHP
jgi:A/G-specific adenine glycosylase